MIETLRRNRLDKCTSAELSIYKAMGEVEKLGADIKLTDAIIKLNEALNLVADYIDIKNKSMPIIEDFTTEKEMNPYILICDCNSTEHQIVIHRDTDDGLIYCHIHLTNRGILSRLKAGLKYIFGYKCKYGHWDEFILNRTHANTLMELANMLAKN